MRIARNHLPGQTGERRRTEIRRHMLLLIRLLWLMSLASSFAPFSSGFLLRSEGRQANGRPRRAAGRAAFLRGRATFRLHPLTAKRGAETAHGSRKFF